MVRGGLLATFALLVACSKTGTPEGGESVAASPMDTVVTADWLEQHLGDPDLVVLDCHVLVEQAEDGGLDNLSGRPSYEAGHIPGAGFADLMGDLSDSESPYHMAFPTPEKFAAAMARLGVGDDTRVVLYDNFNSVWAARVWWMLRWIGFDQAAILDGGLEAWKAGGRTLSTEPVARPERRLTVRLRPELIADRAEVLASIGAESVTLVDSLPAGHYRGDWTLYDRPGHIPGAANVPATSLVDDDGRFRQSSELESLFTGDRDARIITYCGGGVAASLDAFILTRLGFTDVAVYAASLQEWTADPDLPMETATEFDQL
jgi:thiosulfate/3-mercaptopyruvate sulfurtransferase